MRSRLWILGTALLGACGTAECESYVSAINECYSTYRDGPGVNYQGSDDFGLSTAYSCSSYSDPFLGPLLSDDVPFGCWTRAINASDCTTDESVAAMLEEIQLDCY